MNQRTRIHALAAFLAVFSLISLSGCVGQEPMGTQKPGKASDASGKFSATAKGFHGDVTVTLTLKRGTLTDATAVGKDETPEVGGRALELMPKNMVAAGTVKVDGISGATYTSDAVLMAAKDALNQSGATLTARKISVDQHMTPGTYYGA